MHQHGYIGRKMRLPNLNKEPAIVIIAFGSSKRGKAALALVENKLAEDFPGNDIFWGYSSEIIRKKNSLNSPHQALAQAEAAGYRKVVVQPLHIFGGTEYQQLAETAEYFPGLRVFLSETLLHRWDYIHETLEVISGEFLEPDEGLNCLALHGTSLAAAPVNIAYLGLDSLVRDLYPNVIAASVEGIPDFSGVIRRVKRDGLHRSFSKIKIIPLMYIAGLHVEDDLMGEDESWRQEFEQLGLKVECPMISHEGSKYFKGLAFYPEIVEMFMDRLKRTLKLAEYY